MSFYGENLCQGVKANGQSCGNKSYYAVNGVLLCGVHSKNQPRIELPKNPNAKIQKAQELVRSGNLAAQYQVENARLGRRGSIICEKMRMMKEVPSVDGFLKVFPNFKHGNRADGFGCPALSPKSLGPVNHGQPGLPPALNLENFHQGNKVFQFEINGQTILPQFFQTQYRMYQDSEPHRHKDGSQGNNIPICSVWVNKNGSYSYLTYFESRQLYCTFYERLVQTKSEYWKLHELLRNGYNLQICGYDAYPVVTHIDQCYQDCTRPFGHELVLYTMLSYPPEQYPWRKFRTLDF